MNMFVQVLAISFTPVVMYKCEQPIYSIESIYGIIGVCDVKESCCKSTVLV